MDKDRRHDEQMPSDFGFLVFIILVAIALVGIGYILGSLKEILQCL